MPPEDARDRFLAHLTRLVAAGIRRSVEAHGHADRGSVAKRVAAHLWSETRREAHADERAWLAHLQGFLGLADEDPLWASLRAHLANPEVRPPP